MSYLTDKHYQLGDFNPINRKAYVEVPDRNFSAARNYQIINETLAETEKFENRLSEKTEKAAGNIADVLASYGCYRLGGGGTKTIDQYLGNELMKKLYGDKLVDKLGRIEEMRQKNLRNGNTLYGGYSYMPGKD